MKLSEVVVLGEVSLNSDEKNNSFISNTFNGQPSVRGRGIRPKYNNIQ